MQRKRSPQRVRAQINGHGMWARAEQMFGVCKVERALATLNGGTNRSWPRRYRSDTSQKRQAWPCGAILQDWVGAAIKQLIV
eukprot:5083972-Pleurochrysis_carterae.AAC.3